MKKNRKIVDIRKEMKENNKQFEKKIFFPLLKKLNRKINNNIFSKKKELVDAIYYILFDYITNRLIFDFLISDLTRKI